MLKKDPRERIDFVELIDQLNPLLIKNLDAIKRIHSCNVQRETPVTVKPMGESRASNSK
jgi:hypothetical protein